MTQPTESQHSYMNVVLKNADPNLMVIDNEKIDKQLRERRAEMDKANPPKSALPVPAQVELNNLRKELFDLKQYAKSFEIKVNNTAGTVHGLEERLTTVLNTKKQFEDEGNVLAARTFEHQAQQLENELAETRDNLTRLQKDSATSARKLRAWQTEFGPRLKELQKEGG